MKRGPNPRCHPEHRTIVFELETLEALQPHADRRGMHVNELVRKIINAVVEDDMVDAVLDDLTPKPVE